MNFVVFSHLRWDFVFQRPQHLMTRCAATSRVFYWEEPLFGVTAAYLEFREINSNLSVVVPHLPSGLSQSENTNVLRFLLKELMSQRAIENCVLWYYTPMALLFSRDISARSVVYDCMDELSAFRGAPAEMSDLEAELFGRADLVFTGGKSLYERKRDQHHSVSCFPSSIDQEFFATARKVHAEMPDQAEISHPRLGFCGVIDERMDLRLLADAADARPNWQFILLGPVVKLEDCDLPQRPNIHYLGQKEYRSLPAYMAGWDLGLLPFARNESTRFISPTKTPEYLAAGLPVVSTPIADVVDPYGVDGLVHIASTADEFVLAIEKALSNRDCEDRLVRVDSYLSTASWDATWKQMMALISEVSYGVRLNEDDSSNLSAGLVREGVV